MQISNNNTANNEFSINKKEGEISSLKNLCFGYLIEHIDQFNFQGVLSDDMIQEFLTHEKISQIFNKIEFRELLEKIGKNNLERVVFKKFPINILDIRSFGYYFPKIKKIELDSCKFENFKPIVLICEKDEIIQSNGLSNINFLDLNLHQNIERKTIPTSTELNPITIVNCEKIPDDVIFSLAKVCHKLSILDLSDRIEISKDAILTLVKENPHLTYVNFNCCENVDDDISFALVQNCSHLEFINLTGCKITDRSLINFAKGCRKLKEIDLNLCSITDKGIITLSENCPDLEILDLGWCNITDESIIALTKNCPRLKEVNLGGCEELTEEAIYLLDESLQKK